MTRLLRHACYTLALSLCTTLLLTAADARAQKTIDVQPALVRSAQQMSSGGPDGFGYRWIDSDEPGGPAYGFVDISSSGTSISLGDDDAQEISFPGGFTFSFYGGDKSSVYIGSNGILTFAAEDADEYSNDDIPYEYTPNDLIAPFWDDLSPDDGGTVYYYHDAENERFIVQWDNVPPYSGSGTYTFQVILQADGDILFQYADVEGGTVDEATVGIENADGTEGLGIAYDQAYLKDDLAIRITTQPPGTPYFTSVPPTQVTEGKPYQYAATAEDPDGAASNLSFTAITLPSWLALTDNGDGTATLSGTPSASDVGYHDVVLEVADGNGKTNEQEFTIGVAGTITIYVDQAATGANDGISWADAYTSLQDALDQANANPLSAPEIRVAAGTYYPDEDQDGDHVADDPTEAFTLTRDGVEIYGGYPTGGGMRDPDLNETILSGDIDQDDEPFAPDTDSDGNPDSPPQTDHLRGTNSLHVLHLFVASGNPSITDQTVLDGFTVTAGKAYYVSGESGSYRGGGLYCEVEEDDGGECSPALANMHFVGNTADDGGAMYIAHSNMTLTDVTFAGNTAFQDGDYAHGKGGAVYNHKGDPTFTNVTFTGNAAPYDRYNPSNGGAVYSYAGDPTFTDVTFTGNTAEYGGGAVVTGSDYAVFENVTFDDNHAGDTGGALSMGTYYVSGGPNLGIVAPTLTNVTFTNNSATWEGGALFIESSSDADDAAASLTSITFTGNAAIRGGAMFTNHFDGVLTDVTFDENAARLQGGAVYNEGYATPTFIDVAFRGNYVHGEDISASDRLCGGAVYFTQGGAYRPITPTFANVLFSGNAAYDVNTGKEAYGGALCNEPQNWGGGGDTHVNPVLVNVTFVGNWAETGGGAVFNNAASGVANAVFTNVIMWGNYLSDSENLTGRQILNQYSNAVITIRHSIVPSAIGDIVDQNDASTHNGGLYANPEFVDADGPDGTYGTSDDDVRLTIGSPAIDAGALDSLDLDGDGTRDVATDLDGNPRVFGGTVDLGAYEYGVYQSESDEPDVGSQTGFFKLGSTGATVFFDQNDSQGGGLSASLTDEKPSGDGLPSNLVQKYWTITESLDGSFTYNLTFDLTGAGGISDFSALMVYKSNDGGQTWAAADELIHDEANRTITAVNLTSFSQFAVGDDENALPVELASFEAAQDGDAVRLTWQTASETANAGFEIQRSEEQNRWAKVAFVEGAGTSTEARSYRFSDETLPFTAETVRYRLRQVDLDGSTAYSRELEVSLGVPEAFALQSNFPNPFQNSTTIRYALPEAADVHLEVFDAVGRRVAVLANERQEAGRKQIRFDASRLASGVYFLRLRTDDAAEVQRMVLAR